MKMIDVPKLLDLDWQYATTGASAAPTEAFWAFYNGYRGEMPRNGISVRKTDGEWTVLFDLRWASPNRQSVIDTLLAEHRAFCAQRDERHQAERARMATEKAAKAAEQKQTALRHAEVLAVRLGPAIETSRQMLTKFGDFYDRKDKVRRIIARFDDPNADALGINDLNVLEDSIQATKNKHSRTLVLALKAKGGVDWPDDEVAAAITKLTLLDLDHAKERNHRGWDAIQSKLWPLVLRNARAQSRSGHSPGAYLGRHIQEHPARQGCLMTRRRAWAAAAVLMFAAIAYVVGGLVWLAGVALLAASYVILVASQ